MVARVTIENSGVEGRKMEHSHEWDPLVRGDHCFPYKLDVDGSLHNAASRSFRRGNMKNLDEVVGYDFLENELARRKK